MMGIITNFLRHFVLLPLFDPSNLTLQADWKIAHIILEIFRWLAVITLAIAIKLIKNKTELQQKNHQLEAEKRTLELQFLKAQMHPHFLFNTLNTLYSETLQSSDKAEQIVLHLSNLLRFILEECSKDAITLAQEIKVIEDYIALEKLRHDKRIHVQFTADAKRDVRISPLIFLTFVENSFKHSLTTIRGTANISISIQSTASEIELTVINDYVEPNGNTGITSTKTGLTNVKQQLDLLYGEKYSLKHDIFNGEYCVTLKIPLFALSHV
jgi:two-component system, LytTR family, sensor kinase